jgi:hypothetical protein
MTREEAAELIREAIRLRRVADALVVAVVAKCDDMPDIAHYWLTERRDLEHALEAITR